MKERDRVSEKISTSVHVEVRWYQREPDTGSIQPVPIQKAQLSPLKAVLFGTSYHAPVVLSAGDIESLQKELGTRQARDITIGRFKGLATVDDNAKLTMEIFGGEQQTADLSEGNKTGTVHLTNFDTVLIGVIGTSQEDVDKEFDTVYSPDNNQS